MERDFRTRASDVLFCVMVVCVVLGFVTLGWALGTAFDG